MGITAKIFKFAQRQQPDQTLTEFYAGLYPEPVRYALTYKEAQMGREEILSLLQRFPNEAIYLITKALVNDREQQVAYFSELTALLLNPDCTPQALRALLRRRIDVLPLDFSVGGAKLAQLNRSGSINWQQAFHDLADRCYAEDPHATPCLVAYTPLVAYQHFVEIYRQQQGAKIIIIVPEWMMDINEPYMGYDITLRHLHPTVTLQPKEECIGGNWQCMKLECRFKNLFCGNCFFIDDTINTAITAGKVRSFWKSEYGLQIPDERIRVITDLRRQSA